MAAKLNVTRSRLATLGARSLWPVVLCVILSISAYSLYYVARHLGVPKIFALGMSTAYDGTALLAAMKSLEYAQEGRSGAAPRMVMVFFAGVSAWLNSLHSVLGHENPLAIPMWAGLPIAAAVVFELYTSHSRALALARLGKRYPAPLPSWGATAWILFPAETLYKLRDYVSRRTFNVDMAQVELLRKERRDRKRRAIHAPEAVALPGAVPATNNRNQVSPPELSVISRSQAVPAQLGTPAAATDRVCERDGCVTPVTGRADRRFCSDTCKAAAGKDRKRAQGE